MQIYRKYTGMMFSLAIMIAFSIISSPHIIADINKIESNSHRLVLEYTPQFSDFREIKTEAGETVFLPNIANATLSGNNEGSPGQLVFSFLVSVPNPNGFQLADVKISGAKKFSKMIAPMPTLIPHNDIALQAYLLDRQKYSEHKLPDWVDIRYEGISRNRHLARVSIYAARYDFFDNSIEIPETVSITINFAPTADRKDNNDDFLPIAINHNETKRFAIAKPEYSTQNSKLTDLNQISNGNWLRLTITEEGIYKIDGAQLSSRGLNVPKELIKTIKLFGHGGDNLCDSVSNALSNDMNEQPIIINTKSNGELESIVFYANKASGFKQVNNAIKHYRNDFTLKNYYLLTFGGSDGLRATVNENPDGIAVNTPDRYFHRLFFNEELINPYPLGAGRTFFGRSHFANPFVDVLHDLIREDDIYYRIGVAHRMKSGNSNVVFKVKQSGNDIRTINMSSSSSEYTHATMSTADFYSPANLVGSDGRSVLSFEYLNNASGATPYFNFYEIHYPRPYVPIDNEISFFSDMNSAGLTEYRINGFAGSPIYGFRIDGKKPVQIKNSAASGGMFVFTADEKSNIASKYFISSKLRNPSSIETVKLSNLRANVNESDMIIITHSAFEQSAKNYADYRSMKSGFDVAVVNVEDIYAEFSSTAPDVAAIRDFIAYAYHNWTNKPKYILLWGDSHFDYRNIQVRTTSYVPAYNSYDSETTINETLTVATDDFFVWVEGNDQIIDLAIGRVPVDSRENGEWYLNKIKHYENNSSTDAWRHRILLVADDSFTGSGKWGDGDLHVGQTEQLSDLLPKEFIQKKMYLPMYPTENVPGGKRKPGVTQDFLNEVNTAGALIFNWTGHGNPRVLAHEEFFERETTSPQMSNMDKLMFISAATCDFGRFDLAGTKSGAEELIFSRLGGAFALFTATRVVGAYANSELNKSFYTALFSRKPSGKFPTMGEAVHKAKQVHSGGNSQCFVLFGDPSMCFHYPENTVEIKSINNQSISDTSILQIKGLSVVNLVAQVNVLNTDQFDDNFNGVAYITLLDGDEKRVITDELDVVYKFTTQGGLLNRSAFPVVNGMINAEFVVPKDISFSENNARLFIYASSDDNRFAVGSNDKIRVDDLEVTAINDGRGPEIKIFLDNYSFKSGDMVRQNPLLIVELWDETGINSTGLGIGHRIEAWIDDNPNPIDLTSNFNTSLSDPKAGTIQQFLYGLSEGVRRIKIRAWDVFNNPSTQETYFRIPGEGEERISDVLLMPNPMQAEGRIQIIHNFAVPFKVELQIFNSTGMLVRSIDEISTSQTGTFLNWDGRSQSGDMLPQGAYYYFVRLISSNGIIQRGGRLGVITR